MKIKMSITRKDNTHNMGLFKNILFNKNSGLNTKHYFDKEDDKISLRLRPRTMILEIDISCSNASRPFFLDILSRLIDHTDNPDVKAVFDMMVMLIGDSHSNIVKRNNEMFTLNYKDGSVSLLISEPAEFLTWDMFAVDIRLCGGDNAFSINTYNLDDSITLTTQCSYGYIKETPPVAAVIFDYDLNRFHVIRNDHISNRLLSDTACIKLMLLFNVGKTQGRFCTIEDGDGYLYEVKCDNHI